MSASALVTCPVFSGGGGEGDFPPFFLVVEWFLDEVGVGREEKREREREWEERGRRGTYQVRERGNIRARDRPESLDTFIQG